MKKIIISALVILGILSSTAVSVFADEPEKNDNKIEVFAYDPGPRPGD